MRLFRGLLPTRLLAPPLVGGAEVNLCQDINSLTTLRPTRHLLSDVREAGEQAAEVLVAGRAEVCGKQAARLVAEVARVAEAVSEVQAPDRVAAEEWTVAAE